MARNSIARDIMRSYLPERNLIKKGDFDALSVKYEARRSPGCARLLALRALDSYQAYEEEEAEGEKTIDFDGVSLEIGRPSVIAGEDGDARIRYGEYDASFLHVDTVRGPQHLRQQLGHVAAYIRLHEDLQEIPYVAGVSYDEMARLGRAAGLREMTIRECDATYMSDVQAQHAISFAASKRPKKFEPAAVYLPTEEFIDTFYK